MRLHRLGPAVIGIVASGALAASAQPGPAPAPRGPAHPLGPLDRSGHPDPRPLPLPNVVDDLDQPSLAAAVLERTIAPYVYDVRICWEKLVRSSGGAGTMRVELVIEHDGRVSRAVVTAPRVTRAERGRLQACVRKVVRGWHFPLRRGATYAVIPFWFQRARGPGEGPPLTCDRPRGCPSREEVRP